MTEPTAFERHLSEALDEIAGPTRIFDAFAVAEQAAAAGTRPMNGPSWIPTRLRGNRPAAVALRLAVATAAILLVAGAVIVAGLLLRRAPVPQACAGAASIDAARPRPGGGDLAWATEPPGTPHGTRIAAVAADGLEARVALLDVGSATTCTLLTSQVGPPSAILATPSGDAIALSLDDSVFVWSRLGLVEVWHEEARAGLAEQQAGLGMAWSPDAMTLAVWITGDARGSLKLIPVDGAQPVELAVLGVVSQAVWSPEGNRIAVSHSPSGIGWDTGVTVIDIQNEAQSPLQTGDALPQFVRAWRDDDRLVVETISPSQPGRVLIVPVEAPRDYTEGARYLPGGSNAPHHRWSVSPAGNWVAVIPDTPPKHELQLVDAVGGSTRTLAGDAGTPAGYEIVAWAPNGEGLAFTTADGVYGSPTGIWVVKSDGSGLRKVGPAGLSLLRGSWIGG